MKLKSTVYCWYSLDNLYGYVITLQGADRCEALGEQDFQAALKDGKILCWFVHFHRNNTEQNSCL